MKIEVFRFNSDKDYTNSVILIDGKYICDGLEDEYRATKVQHETRIPDGDYKIEFRTVGGFHDKHLARYGSWHRGMLWVKNVPGFEYILIHSGNTDDDTSGCLLVGFAAKNNQNMVANSRMAYEAFYPMVRDALLRNEGVTIKYVTLDDVNK